MAYRSDVRLVVSKDGYKQLKKYVNENLPESHKEYNLLQSPDVELENEEQVYLGWNATKWYEYSDFKEVDVIMNGLKDLMKTEYSYNYARLGENADDYEESSFTGERDKELYLEFPQLERYFDDDSFEDIYKKDNKEDIEV